MGVDLGHDFQDHLNEGSNGPSGSKARTSLKDKKSKDKIQKSKSKSYKLAIEGDPQGEVGLDTSTAASTPHHSGKSKSKDKSKKKDKKSKDKSKKKEKKEKTKKSSKKKKSKEANKTADGETQTVKDEKNVEVPDNQVSSEDCSSSQASSHVFMDHSCEEGEDRDVYDLEMSELVSDKPIDITVNSPNSPQRNITFGGDSTPAEPPPIHMEALRQATLFRRKKTMKTEVIFDSADAQEE